MGKDERLTDVPVSKCRHSTLIGFGVGYRELASVGEKWSNIRNLLFLPNVYSRFLADDERMAQEWMIRRNARDAEASSCSGFGYARIGAISSSMCLGFLAVEITARGGFL